MKAGVSAIASRGMVGNSPAFTRATMRPAKFRRCLKCGNAAAFSAAVIVSKTRRR